MRKLLVLLLAGLPAAAEACPVCFGAPGSTETKAIEMAIWFLLGVLGVVFAWLGAFFFYLMVRNRKPLPHEDELAKIAGVE
jgi:hypothetical protein